MCEYTSIIIHENPEPSMDLDYPWGSYRGYTDLALNNQQQ